MENNLDRRDLKILAYKEKVAQLEDENANLRVEVTILNSQLEFAKREADVSEEADSNSE